MSATGDRNTIASELSHEELLTFLDECVKTPKLTLGKIQELAAKRGITISKMSATSFRDTTFQRHLDQIQSARQFAELVGEIPRRPGNTVADAASDILSKRVFDRITNPEEPIDLAEMSLVVKRLRDGDSRVKNLELQVQRLKVSQIDIAKVAIEKASQIKTITADTKLESGAKLERVRQLLFGVEEAA